MGVYVKTLAESDVSNISLSATTFCIQILSNSSVLTETARRTKLLFYASRYKLHESVQFLGRFAKLRKATIKLRHVCLSISPHGTALLQLHVFFMKSDI